MPSVEDKALTFLTLEHHWPPIPNHSNKAAPVRSPLHHGHLDSGFSDSGESGNADNNGNVNKEMHSEVVHETRTNSLDQR